jgi:hypothetical protein
MMKTNPIDPFLPGGPALTPADKLLAITGTPPAPLFAPDAASPTRTERLAVYDQAGGSYIVTRRSEVGGQVEETGWVCDTP